MQKFVQIAILLGIFIFAMPRIALCTQSAHDYRVSLSLSAFIVAGALWPHFEYCINGQYSVLLEGAYYIFGPSAGDYEAAIGFRRYFSNSKGGFFGIFVRAGKQSGTPWGKTTEDLSYNYETPFLAIGGNFGWKWQWKRGFFITTRVGYGYPFTDVKWNPGRPEPAWIHRFTAALMGVDMEASLGYAF